jgi:hypothetical protein
MGASADSLCELQTASNIVGKNDSRQQLSFAV